MRSWLGVLLAGCGLVQGPPAPTPPADTRPMPELARERYLGTSALAERACVEQSPCGEE
ncbi:MAG: hypothetical protein ACI8PZ_001005 [Myxococcota bacterium]|jgi:hypothetical protein